MVTLVAWRDDGFWILSWQRVWFLLRGVRKTNLPPPHSIGRAYGSLAGNGRGRIRPVSTQLSRIRSTSNAPRWRLTSEWEIYPDMPRVLSSNSPEASGKRWDSDGAASSRTSPTRRIST